jgi:Flp pilus assembly pilin Flp
MLFHFALQSTVAVQAALIQAFARLRSRSEQGQATAEYALVLLGVAALALVVVGWATKTGKVGKLLDTVLDTMLAKVK